MKQSLKTGLSFGLTSGIITTLGLLVGLNAGTHSKLVIIGGILTIAIADAFSDSLGIHISEESKKRATSKQIWEATISTFVAKFIFTMLFLIPILTLELEMAIIVSIVIGLSFLGLFSYYIAKEQDTKPSKVIAEHIFIALLVIVATHYVGKWIFITFN